MDIESGQRLWNCEISSIDTALLLCGVLTCRAHFTGGGIEAEIREMASALYDRVDWTWMLEGELTYSMGWKPESGFLKARWSTYSELMMLYLLGMGSRTYPAPSRTWLAFARPYINYQGLHYISDLAPLFIHQFSHAWFDFREKRDRYTNYFQNSIVATRAHKVSALIAASLTRSNTGVLLLPIRSTAIPRGAARLSWGAWMDRSCPAPQPGRYRFCRRSAWKCCPACTQLIRRPSDATGSSMHSIPRRTGMTPMCWVLTRGLAC